MKIIIDTREQQKLWIPDGINIVAKKLDEGDYSTELLEQTLTFERKSPNDLYGSIYKGHKRFKKEILRAKEKNKEFIVIVECNKEHFISMQWKPKGIHFKATPKILAAIIKTMEEHHNIKFIWCENREVMKEYIINYFNTKEIIINEKYINM